MINTIYTTQDQMKFGRAPSIFLAGPTPRSNQPHLRSWRPKMFEALLDEGFSGNLLWPESAPGDTSPRNEQHIEWELFSLSIATVVLFWIPRKMESLPGLTTNIEFGWTLAHKYHSNKNIVVGLPTDSEHNEHIQYLCKRYNVPVFRNMHGTAKEAVSIVERTVKLV